MLMGKNGLVRSVVNIGAWAEMNVIIPEYGLGYNILEPINNILSYTGKGFERSQKYV